MALTRLADASMADLSRENSTDWRSSRSTEFAEAHHLNKSCCAVFLCVYEIEAPRARNQDSKQGTRAAE